MKMNTNKTKSLKKYFSALMIILATSLYAQKNLP